MVCGSLTSSLSVSGIVVTLTLMSADEAVPTVAGSGMGVPARETVAPTPVNWSATRSVASQVPSWMRAGCPSAACAAVCVGSRRTTARALTTVVMRMTMRRWVRSACDTGAPFVGRHHRRAARSVQRETASHQDTSMTEVETQRALPAHGGDDDRYDPDGGPR